MSVILTKPINATRPSDDPAKFAKLALPGLFDAMVRPRLHAQIDRLCARHAVVWVTSPPGAGKTSLAANYLAASQRPAMWYQVDESDSDPATLFFFLGEALRSLPSVSVRPLFEYKSDASNFNRLFFRNFYAQLPPGTLIVFDNIHEFDWKNSGALMESALAEIPEGVTVMALSRDLPPARLARMEAGGKIAVLGWNELRLDCEEALTLAGLTETATPNERAWLRMVDGWAAGIVLLRNASQHSGSNVIPHFDGRDAVFRYFAGEIFERMPKNSQLLLLQLSYFPGFSANNALALTDDVGALALVRKLYENCLFVERRGTECQTYHFHALFREFLQFEVEQRFDSTERTQLLERAAKILNSDGRVEESAQLIQRAGNHSQLVSLLLEHAASMTGSGRGQIWRDWMSGLPSSIVDAEPELWYWHGISVNEISPRRARQILMRAERSFYESGQLRWQLLTIAAIIESFDADWSDCHLLGHWVTQLQDGLHQVEIQFDGNLSDPDLDLILHSRLVLALMLSTPNSPTLGIAAQRVLHTFPMVSNAVARLTAGVIMLRFFESGIEDANGATVKWLLDELKLCADDPAISPFHRVKWYGRVARWHSKDGNYEESQQIAGAAKDIVSSFNLDPVSFQLIEVNHLLGTGNLSASRSLLDQLHKTISPMRSADLMELHALEANWKSLSGNVEGALESMQEATRISAERALPAMERSRFESFLACCYSLMGNFELVDDCFAAATDHAYGHDVLMVNEARQFVTAYGLWKRGGVFRAIEQLREAMTAHRQRQATSLFPMMPNLASQLAEMALRENIEVEHVRSIINRQKLCAPDRFTANWPWPVAVHTFGKFELSIKGEKFVSSGKAQQRPLMLLKALIIAGDRGNSMDAVAAQLWPDSDDAKATLNVTVHRLRKILSCDDSVVVNGGKIRLSEKMVWSDLAVIANLCSEIESLGADAPIETIQAYCFELLNLYRGPFCEDEEGSWTIPVRERWRNRFLGAADRLGQRLEEGKNWEPAIALYRRAIEAEPLAESCYRGLMRCLHAQGDSASVVSAYRRLCTTLSVVAGLSPSADTINLTIALSLNSCKIT
jgi:LuxR family maltose regulon positive regulatory protein